MTSPDILVAKGRILVANAIVLVAISSPAPKDFIRCQTTSLFSLNPLMSGQPQTGLVGMNICMYLKS